MSQFTLFTFLFSGTGTGIVIEIGKDDTDTGPDLVQRVDQSISPDPVRALDLRGRSPKKGDLFFVFYFYGMLLHESIMI